MPIALKNWGKGPKDFQQLSGFFFKPRVLGLDTSLKCSLSTGAIVCFTCQNRYNKSVVILDPLGCLR